jgi:short-subunit dehydrogenase
LIDEARPYSSQTDPSGQSFDRARSSHIAITGASSGLGAALARSYAAPGVLLTLSARHKERLERVGAECADAGATVRTVLCDVTDASAMAGWLAEADQFAKLDIVFANAGIGGKDAIAPRQGENGDAARLIFAVNALGVINTAAPIIPRFVERRAGHFVVIASLAGGLGLPHSPAYCGAKAAARTYAEGLRRLVRPNVRVTIINPGYIDTPMARSLPFKAPFIWSAEQAAKAIKSAVAKGKREYTFPWQLRLAVGAGRFFPHRLVDAVLSAAYRRSFK